MLLLLYFAVTNIHGQQEPSIIAKVAPASIFGGKVTFGGEYNFKHRNSVTLLVGVPAAITHRFDYDDKESDVDFKGFSLMAGYRYYLGKKSASGMYIEPYLKYLKHEGEGELEGTLENETARFYTTTKYEGYGLGAQIGAQFLLGKRFVIDLFFFGPEANMSTFSSNSVDVSSNIPWSDFKAEEAENDIREALDDIPLLKNNTEVEVNQAQKRVTTKFDGFLPGFRFGLSFGFKF